MLHNPFPSKWVKGLEADPNSVIKIAPMYEGRRRGNIAQIAEIGRRELEDRTDKCAQRTNERGGVYRQISKLIRSRAEGNRDISPPPRWKRLEEIHNTTVWPVR